MRGDVERANLLNETFANKFTDPEVHDYPEERVYDLSPPNQFEIIETRVRSALSALQSHKACGPDNISARVV